MIEGDVNEEELDKELEEELRRAMSEDGEDDEEGEDEDGLIPLAFDKDGNPLSPPMMDGDGNILSRKEAARAEALLKQQQIIESRTTTVVQGASRPEKTVQMSQQNNILETLKKTQQEVSISISLNVAPPSVLKTLKENSEISEQDFINYVSSSVNQEEIAKTIWEAFMANK